MKSNFVKNLLSKWYVFALWAVAAVILWHWAVGMITRPAKEEKMAVFICSTRCDREKTLETLQKARPDYVKQLDFRWYAPTDEMFNVYYDAFAVYESDLIVMPKSKLNEFSYVDFFELDAEKTEKAFGRTFEYYAADGKIYGIKIDSGWAGAQSFFDEEETYWLFFNKNSLHLGELSGSPRSGATALAKALM